MENVSTLKFLNVFKKACAKKTEKIGRYESHEWNNIHNNLHKLHLMTLAGIVIINSNNDWKEDFII